MSFYFRADLALSKLGLQPRLIFSSHRRALQENGRTAGDSPQEVALWIAAQFPLIDRMHISVPQISSWIVQQKIDPNAPRMEDAIAALALWDVVPTIDQRRKIDDDYRLLSRKKMQAWALIVVSGTSFFVSLAAVDGPSSYKLGAASFVTLLISSMWLRTTLINMERNSLLFIENAKRSGELR